MKREELASCLLSKGIETSIYYPMPLYKQKAYQGMFQGMHLENTEKACQEVLSIPVHPMLTKKDIDKIWDSDNTKGMHPHEPGFYKKQYQLKSFKTELNYYIGFDVDERPIAKLYQQKAAEFLSKLEGHQIYISI